MIKTIKVKKKLRLDELIKYIREERVGEGNYKEYLSDCQKYKVRASGYKLDYVSKLNFINPNIPLNTTFAVEEEEEIDNDTIFEEVYRVTKEGEVTTDTNKSINGCLDWKDYQVQIFAMLDGKLELIWEENK